VTEEINKAVEEEIKASDILMNFILNQDKTDAIVPL
jgi:hypothetical protein